MKFGGIDWNNRHPDTLDIEPGSCEYWIQMDKHYGTTSDSPLSHKSKHETWDHGCKPMARVEMKDVDRISSWTLRGKNHTRIVYWHNGEEVWACSCDYDKDYDDETGNVP